jgi:hypothetical protein
MGSLYLDIDVSENADAIIISVDSFTRLKEL